MKQDSQKQKNKTTGKPCVNIYTRRIFRAFDDGIGDDTWFTHLPAWPWGSWKIESLISSEVTASVWHHNSRNWKWNCPDTITEKWFLVQELNLLQGRRVLVDKTGLSQMQDSANLSTSKRGTGDTKSGNFLWIAKMKEETEMEVINWSRLLC